MEFILDILGKIGFEWQMGLFNLINFLVVFWILKHFAFQPTIDIINTRREHAKESEENFQKAKTELQMAEKRAQNIVDEAKVAGNKVIEAKTKEASAQAEKLRDKSKREIETLVKQAKKNIEIEREDMRGELASETATLVSDAVEQILKEKLDEKKDNAMIEKTLASLRNTV